VLLLDEPTSGVDPVTINKISQVIRDLLVRNIAVAVIEHNISFLQSISDEVLVMDRGRQVAFGEPEEITSRREVLDAYFGCGFVGLGKPRLQDSV